MNELTAPFDTLTAFDVDVNAEICSSSVSSDGSDLFSLSFSSAASLTPLAIPFSAISFSVSEQNVFIENALFADGWRIFDVFLPFVSLKPFISNESFEVGDEVAVHESWSGRSSWQIRSP